MINKYENFVTEMWFAPSEGNYCAIALGGEVGEVLNEVKKQIRDGGDRSEKILDELGDTLFYLTRLGHEYGFGLNDIMKYNMNKLQKRQLETGRP